MSSAVLFLLLAVVTVVFQTVLDYHRRTDAQITLERSLLLTLKQISRECSESSWASFELDTNALVFATPRDQTGSFLVGPQDEPAWAGLNCYSRESDAGRDILAKRTEYFGAANDTVPEPNTLTPPRNLTWFLASSLPRRVVQRNLEQFVVTREAVGDEDGRDTLSITLAAHAGEASGPHRYSLELKTRVRPRN